MRGAGFKGGAHSVVRILLWQNLAFSATREVPKCTLRNSSVSALRGAIFFCGDGCRIATKAKKAALPRRFVCKFARRVGR